DVADVPALDLPQRITRFRVAARSDDPGGLERALEPARHDPVEGDVAQLGGGGLGLHASAFREHDLLGGHAFEVAHLRVAHEVDAAPTHAATARRHSACRRPF